MTSIPEKLLVDLISGKIDEEFEFLALNILLARLRQEARTRPDPATIQKGVKELQSLFAKFGNLPCTKSDIDRIMKARS